MTPFDGQALLAMLLAFYPTPTISNLRRAREQRPEYFAGGELFGTCGEKLRLPDGRVFDLMFDCGGPRARWQILGGGPGGPSVDDPFALEEGPLRPIDEFTEPRGEPVQVFEPLLAGALYELGASDGVLLGAERTTSEAIDPGRLAARFGTSIEDASGGLGDQARRLSAIDVGSLIEATHGSGFEIAAKDREAQEQEPEGLPELPDTPTPPGRPPPVPGAPPPGAGEKPAPTGGRDEPPDDDEEKPPVTGPRTGPRSDKDPTE